MSSGPLPEEVVMRADTRARVVETLGLQHISDADQLGSIAQQVISDNPDAATQFKNGKETTIKFLVGQVMRATRGKANPQLAEQVLREQLLDQN